MKRLLKVALVLLVLLILLVASVPLWIDAVGRTAVNQEATKALGVETVLSSMNLSIFGESCTLDELTVKNPEGYEAAHFMTMKSGHVAVDARSLLGEEAEVQTIQLEGIRVNLERKGTRANYREILANLERAGGEKAEEDAAGPKFIIREIVVKDIHVEARVSAVGVLRPAVHVEIAEIRLADVGTGEGGVGLATVVRKVMAAILSAVAESGAGLPKEIVSGLGEGLKDVPGVAVRIVGGVGKGAGGIVEGVGKGIGGLFGGDEDEEERDDADKGDE